MSDKSKIEWTDATWNPVVGCTKVSPGCDHCYAERIVERFKGKGAFEVVERSEAKLYAPLKWRTPRRVFVNSMSDLFHDDVPESFIARVFSVMARTPQHTYQLLTKRHARMRSLLNRPDFQDQVSSIYTCAGWPLPNLWVGVSVEDQKWADIRIPALIDTPAAVRWISAEPLLGPVSLHAHDDGLRHWLPDFGPQYDDGSGEPVCQAHGISRCRQGCAFLDWVVVGGESGPGARTMHPDWARALRDQCTAAGVAYHFKQWGEWCHTEQMPEDTWSWLDSRINLGQQPHPEPHRVGKKRAGRLLDGREWNQYPEAS